jgi:S1-C subfamily serine protease
VNLLDLLLIVAAVAATIGGYRLGFTTRVLSWIGLALGLLAGVRALPWLLDRLDGSSQVEGVALIVAVVVGSAALGQGVGLWIGSRVAPDPSGGRGAVDRALGAVAGFVGLVVIAWLILPVLDATPGWPSRLANESTLARAVSESLPRPPDVSRALRSLVGEDNYPRVFDALQPSPDVGAPPAASGLSAAVSQTVARSVVKVEGVACSKVQDGTGWVVGDGLVVTNAHVVAGERTTDVERDDGRRLDASVVVFDPARDLALLQVRKLDRPALPVAEARRDETGGVFGHPGGEALRIAPFQVARELEAVGRDIYDQAPTRREVLELAASLRPGDSGSALVDPAGEVVGVAFAIATERSDVAYALATSELESVLQAPRGDAVSTGPCLG